MPLVDTAETDIQPAIPDLKQLLASPSSSTLLDSLSSATERHKVHLRAVGLADRATMRVTTVEGNSYSYDRGTSSELPNHVSGGPTLLQVPELVQDFNTDEKNTLITTTSGSGNCEEDIQKILKIRLYPALMGLLQQLPLEIYHGEVLTMVNAYRMRGYKTICRFQIPSSAEYYLLREVSSSKYMMLMAGLCGEENMLAQLLTLKLAEIELANITVFGNPHFYLDLAETEAENAVKMFPGLSAHPTIILVASCETESILQKIILEKQWNTSFENAVYFKGSLIKLIYYSAKDLGTNMVIVSRVYGDTMEFILNAILKRIHCTFLFSGGAGGFIPLSTQSRAEWPPIGTFIYVNKSLFPNKEVVEVSGNESLEDISTWVDSRPHLHISGILLETYRWLDQWRDIGSTVDIETGHILNAVAKYNLANPNNTIFTVCDYVGAEPLRSYKSVYDQYDAVIDKFLNIATRHFAVSRVASE
ncbi:hypothetical protein ACMFMG_002717 [Clarireedia jacksonii]